MSRTKEELKKIAIEAIDAYRDEIIALGDSIESEPELGFKELKTAEKFQKALDRLGISYESGVAVTGVVAALKGKESKIRLAVMGDLDAAVSREHPKADPETGAAHCCGHNAQIACLLGVARAMKHTGILEELSGDVVLMAVPAEEYLETDYRRQLRESGKIKALGGKQEFIRLGVMDGIDMMVMQHSYPTEEETASAVKGEACTVESGFISKKVQYIGKDVHAGNFPHLGINSLNAASVGLVAVNAQRETFQDKDCIQVHSVMTKGGELVNTIPADVRIETQIRAANAEAIKDADFKVTRAFQAGGDAVGAKTVITDFPGYMPSVEYPEMAGVMYGNLAALLGEENVSLIPGKRGSGSSGQADIQAIMPAIQARIGGGAGALHTKNYRLTDKETAYISAAKVLAMTVIDLLAEGAETGIDIKNASRPPYTKERYLKEWLKL